jgi:hypothetical protein
MPIDNLILQTLNNSNLTEELRDAEIEILTRLFEVREFKKGVSLLRPGEEQLKNSLIVLASGEVEAVENRRHCICWSLAIWQGLLLLQGAIFRRSAPLWSPRLIVKCCCWSAPNLNRC